MGEGMEDYPNLDAVTCDAKELRLVSPTYAGRTGELTAILQYVYQSVLLAERGDEERAKKIERIAVQEMLHLEVLGKLICKLGAPPVFTACPPYPVGYYSASSVNYARRIEEMLDGDIRAEKGAIEGYTHIIQSTRSPVVRVLIEQIREEEREHLLIFEQLRAELREG